MNGEPRRDRTFSRERTFQPFQPGGGPILAVFDAATGSEKLRLLAGGDTRRGWEAFQANGLQQKIVERYYADWFYPALQAPLTSWSNTPEASLKANCSARPSGSSRATTKRSRCPASKAT